MFSFPNPVNEKAARVVAGVVAIAGLIILATGAVLAADPGRLRLLGARADRARR